MPDLAVIMSIYHRDRLSFVKESVESILHQTFCDFHYYITFDGPVKQEVDEYVSSLKDDRIRLYKLEQNRGLAVALNYMLAIILKNHEYKYIARMDADDISMPERFEKQRSYFISHPEITILGSWYEEIDEIGRHLALRKLPTDHEVLRRRYFTRTPFAHSSVMFDRHLIEIGGYYPENTVNLEDIILWGRAIYFNMKIANMPECLIKVRLDENFYRRRSSLRYGYNYIIMKSRINKTLKSTLINDIFTLFLGFMKMLPSKMIYLIYLIDRRINYNDFYLNINSKN